MSNKTHGDCRKRRLIRGWECCVVYLDSALLIIIVFTENDSDDVVADVSLLVLSSRKGFPIRDQSCHMKTHTSNLLRQMIRTMTMVIR